MIGARRYTAVSKSCLSYFQPRLIFDAPSCKLLPLTSQLEQSHFPLWAFANHYYVGLEFGIRRHYKSAPLQESKMIDRRRIHVTGGAGGDGCTSFRRSRHARRGVADGGRGGKGGDVILKCSAEVWDFGHLQHHFNAERGGIGSSKKRVGSRGQDKTVHVPVGTVIHLVSGSIPSSADTLLTADNMVLEDKGTLVLEKEKDLPLQAEISTNQVIIADEAEGCSSENSEADCDEEVSNSSGMDMEQSDSSGDCEYEQDHREDDSSQMAQNSVAELLRPDQSLTVACGGEGGRGNAAMARGRGCEKKLPSREHESGHPGTEAFLVLELKTIADVGLVGFPNAGKSTLLGSISRAKPQVGHYAFTTLRPNLGKLEFEDFFSITVADIPGLIKGAHKNVGLGHDFLRHIERTKALAYVVDLAATLGDRKGLPPWDQFEELKFELEMYQSGLSSRTSLVVATKLDEEGAEDILQELRMRLPCMHIVPVCAILEQGIHDLRIALRELVSVPES